MQDPLRSCREPVGRLQIEAIAIRDQIAIGIAQLSNLPRDPLLERDLVEVVLGAPAHLSDVELCARVVVLEDHPSHLFGHFRQRFGVDRIGMQRDGVEVGLDPTDAVEAIQEFGGRRAFLAALGRFAEEPGQDCFRRGVGAADRAAVIFSSRA